jgi:hypothetical protein
MADERRKGPPDRRRTRSSKPTKEERPANQDPNDAARFDAEQLDASLRERQQEDRGEVL